MSRLDGSKIVAPRADFASRSELCRTFEREMKALYLLAFLLTANHKEAEQCFAVTLQEVLQEQAVFKDWALCWIKRTLIKNAIDIVSPAHAVMTEAREPWTVGLQETFAGYRIDAVTQLKPLERFVFVLSVLERYSGRECSILLGCSTAKLVEARLGALRGLVTPMAQLSVSEDREPGFLGISA